jgi:hypothetical protein
MAIEALEGVTDEELFNQANADEAPADEAVVEPAEPAEQVEQPRDEAGRFAEKPADEPVALLQPISRQPRRLTTTQQWFRRGVCGRSTRKSGRLPKG